MRPKTTTTALKSRSKTRTVTQPAKMVQSTQRPAKPAVPKSVGSSKSNTSSAKVKSTTTKNKSIKSSSSRNREEQDSGESLASPSVSSSNQNLSVGHQSIVQEHNSHPSLHYQAEAIRQRPAFSSKNIFDCGQVIQLLLY